MACFGYGSTLKCMPERSHTMTKTEIDARFGGNKRVHAALCRSHGHSTDLPLPEQKPEEKESAVAK